MGAAAYNGSADAVQALLAARAQLEARALFGVPLYVAAISSDEHDNPDAVRALLAAGARPEALFCCCCSATAKIEELVPEAALQMEETAAFNFETQQPQLANIAGPLPQSEEEGSDVE